jgi:hypothetical protein
MKTVRYLFLTGMAVASLCGSRSVLAQVSSTPAKTNPLPPLTMVPPTATPLGGVPPAIKTMITSFDITRDNYLAAQNLLLIQIKKATTATERQQIRAELQANRQAFLAALRHFRQQLKTELAALKGKISHEEFLRIIDAAHNAAIEGGLNHHRGH